MEHIIFTRCSRTCVYTINGTHARSGCSSHLYILGQLFTKDGASLEKFLLWLKQSRQGELINLSTCYARRIGSIILINCIHESDLDNVFMASEELMALVKQWMHFGHLQIPKITLLEKRGVYSLRIDGMEKKDSSGDV